MFSDVSVVDVVGESILRNQDVYISRKTIEQIIPTGRKKTKKYKEISGEGKYLIPGLMDAHAHLPRAQGLEMPM